MHDVLLKRWSEIGEKIVQLAEEFPNEQYEFRPATAARSFAEQLRHVAFWNVYVAQTLRRAPADGDANELSREAFPAKAEILPALRASVDDVRVQLETMNGASNGEDAETLIAFIEHNGEHYGQLVMYYRLNDLVPPASR